MIKRAFDFSSSLLALILLSPVLLVVGAAVRITSPGPALFWSERFGAGSTKFTMPKFRTMKLGTPQLPTHLLPLGESRLTPIGKFLRRSSLDELPQLGSVVVGHMSLVGPRPALFNQNDLMALRVAAGVDHLRPGITGWAQVNGRDELAIPDKVAFEKQYLERATFWFDLKIIFLTLRRGGTGVAH